MGDRVISDLEWRTLHAAAERVAELERFVLAIAHGPDGSVSDSVRKRAKELWDKR